MCNKTYVGDIGTIIKLNAGEDISAAVTKQIKYKKPSGVTGVWTATLDGTNYLTYTTIAGAIDEAGDWELQIYIDLTTWQGLGCTATLEVFDIFK